MRAVAVLFLLAACEADAPSVFPDAPRILVAQICAGETCTSSEACITDWTVTCALLTNPPDSCTPCSPGANVYRCVFSGCRTLPAGCYDCACLGLDATCRCEDTGSSLAVYCNEPD